jgi:elongation factor Ts
MNITAAQVKELRQATGCGMMDCKKALAEANGDMEKASDILRTKGMAKAAKKAGRIAAEGIITLRKTADNKQAVMLEVNSETDFVARDENFLQFVDMVVAKALDEKADNVETLSHIIIEADKTIEQVRQELIVKIGENINLRRAVFVSTDGVIGAYLHGTRIGVLVALKGGDVALAKDIAMHVAAAKPLIVTPEQADQEMLTREKGIYHAQALETGKPEHIVEKIVAGRIKKYLDEISLQGQPFVKNPDISVGQLLKEKNAQVEAFIRFELGEGIEKKEENFAAEVKAQVEAAQ